MSLPVGTKRYVPVVVAANASYPTVSNAVIMFDLSKCDNIWWSKITSSGDIVVYDPLSDTIKPRNICSDFNVSTKTGWISVDSAMSSAGRTLWLCAAPGYGAVNSAAAHTNSNCYTAYGYDEASGNIVDKTGAYAGSAGNLTYAQTGIVCKAVSFNGNNSQISMGAVSQLDSATAHTFQFLFSQRDFAQTDIIMRLGGTSSYIMIYSSSSSINFLIQTAGVGASGRFVTSTQFTANTLELGTFVFNGSGATNADRMKIYVGNSLTPVALTFTGTIPATLPIVNDSGLRAIGYNSSSLDGLIDESKFYSRGVSAGEHFLARKNLLDHNNFATYSASVAIALPSTATPLSKLLNVYGGKYHLDGTLTDALSGGVITLGSGVTQDSNKKLYGSSSYAFASGNAGINLGANVVPANCKKIAVSMLVNYETATTGARTFFSCGTGTTYFSFSMDATNYILRIGTSTDRVYLSKAAITPYLRDSTRGNTWNTFTIVIDLTVGTTNNTKCQIFINELQGAGSFSNQGTFATAIPTGDFIIGQHSVAGHTWHIDQMGIFFPNGFITSQFGCALSLEQLKFKKFIVGVSQSWGAVTYPGDDPAYPDYNPNSKVWRWNASKTSLPQILRTRTAEPTTLTAWAGGCGNQLAAGFGADVVFLDAAVGNTALIEGNGVNGSWYPTSTSALYSSMLMGCYQMGAGVDANNNPLDPTIIQFDGIISTIGTADASDLADADIWLANYIAVHEQICVDLGQRVPMYFEVLGPATADTTFVNASYDRIRNACRLLDDPDNNRILTVNPIGIEIADDDAHPARAGDRDRSDMWAQGILANKGIRTTGFGYPLIQRKSVGRYVVKLPSGVTDFTPTSNISGFADVKASDNVVPATATEKSGLNINVTYDGTVVRDAYLYGSNPDRTNIIYVEFSDGLTVPAFPWILNTLSSSRPRPAGHRFGFGF